ncbi:hypothetical protein EJK80_04860 [Corynebacterium phoceense]|uniref:Secreted protein n=1 Tax=Corynebacterium phoceense TaxID=1686286 RepID=A0A540R804_9CORY|nr:hypothetical protein [Corynebacterium phoceense]TQE43869.1 hypothetical protein EJK80_04860 [Corynebacterium phoceense]
MRRAAVVAIAASVALLTAPAQAAPTLDDAAWESVRTPQIAELSVTEISAPRRGEDLHVTLEIVNTSDTTMTDLQVTTRRGDRVSTVDAGRSELATGQFPYFAATAAPADLEPGERTTVELRVPTGLNDQGTLALDEDGVYPLMFALTGFQDGAAHALADDRLLLPVGDSKAKDSLTVLYPLTATVDIVPGETGGESLILQSEQLAGQLGPEGRLTRLVDTYLDHNQPGCVVLDPALVDVASRMADGYTVASNRPSIVKKPQRLRDSWGSTNDTAGVEGTGSAAAQAFLDKLKKLDCISTMPWANADQNAAAKTRNAWLLHEAVARGNETIEDTLGITPTTILVPGNGYVTSDFTTNAPYADLGTPTVLVADNTTVTGSEHYATYNASLASLLAATGSRPETTAYSNPALRYDFAADAPASRALSAAAGIRLARTEHAAPEADKDAPLVAKLPNQLDPAAAAAVLDELAQGAAEGGIGKLGAAETNNQPGSPYADPAALSGPEILLAEQQARYADELMLIMVNDPNIALTRYGFTLPLRRDLLMALSLNDRQTASGYQDAIVRSTRRFEANSEQLQELRASVSLIPPGNVYTRSSQSSPLLIVAENSLPLPVEAHIKYEGPKSASLNTPETLRVPAKGSITVSMTADLPTDRRTDLRLWLATPDGATISQPVTIAVQTRGGMLSVYGLGGLVALLALGALAVRLRRASHKKK